MRNGKIAKIDGVAELGEDFCNVPNVRNVDVGYPGWAALIAAAVRRENGLLEGTGSVLVIDQTKEKFGTLRLYCHVEGPDDQELADGQSPVELPVVDGMGPGDFMDMAEAMSSVMCMGCGMPAVTGGRGWVSTLCPSCRKKSEKDRSYLWEGADPVVTRLSDKHLAFFMAWHDWLRMESWKAAVERSKEHGSEPPAAAQYGAEGAMERLVVRLEGLTAEDAVSRMGNDGPSPLHYPLGHGFLEICEAAGLVCDPGKANGMDVFEIMGCMGLADDEGTVAFWESRIMDSGLVRPTSGGVNPSA